MWGLSLVVASGGHSSSRCTGLSLSRPLWLWSTGSRRTGSAIVAHGPSRSTACGIFPDQGSNLWPLHWQGESQPLRHQGSPLCYCFVSISFISALLLMISFLLLTFLCSSFSSCFKCRVRLFIWDVSCFLRWNWIAVNFPLRTAFAASYRLWVIVFSLSFVSMYFLISSLISSVISWLFSSALFILHVFVFLQFFSCNWFPIS